MMPLRLSMLLFLLLVVVSEVFKLLEVLLDMVKVMMADMEKEMVAEEVVAVVEVVAEEVAAVVAEEVAAVVVVAELVVFLFIG